MEANTALKVLTDEEVDHVDTVQNGMFEVMGPRGDTKYIWNRNEPTEVELAKQTFDGFRAKGYVAYRLEGKDGTKGEQMHEFDPRAERVLFAAAMRGGC